MLLLMPTIVALVRNVDVSLCRAFCQYYACPGLTARLMLIRKLPWILRHRPIIPLGISNQVLATKNLLRLKQTEPFGMIRIDVV